VTPLNDTTRATWVTSVSPVWIVKF